MHRRTLLAASLAAPSFAAPALRPALAQWTPDRPLRLIVPFAAGGPADIFGRLFAEALSARLDQPVVVENRAGAGGLVGTDVVAKATPDGLTLGFTGPGALSIAPAMQQTMPLDVWRDLVHLTLVVRVPEVLVVNAASGPATLDQLVAQAKARPGELSFGSAGMGSLTHVAGALLASAAGIDVVHVPYRGAAPATTDMLAGRIIYMIADVPVLKPHIDAGRLRALAVTTSKRIPDLPDVPTTAELGLPQVISDNWYGLAVAAGAPEAARERLRAAALEALQSTALAEGFASRGGLVSPLDTDAYLAFLRAEAEKWGKVVRETGADRM